MEFIGEFITEMVFEGASEAIHSKRIPKYIRYPLTAMVILFVVTIISAVITAGLSMLSTHIFCGVLLTLFGTLMASLASKHFSAELRALREEHSAPANEDRAG